jgi:hypothetical protein
MTGSGTGEIEATMQMQVMRSAEAGGACGGFAASAQSHAFRRQCSGTLPCSLRDESPQASTTRAGAFMIF